MALGGGAKATQFDGLAVGIVANASGIEGSAFGGAEQRERAGQHGVGFRDRGEWGKQPCGRRQRTISGASSVALGEQASATQTGSIAVGLNSVSSAEAGSAFGPQSSVTAAGGTALGSNCERKRHQRVRGRHAGIR
jgi:hypothetical protein